MEWKQTPILAGKSSAVKPRKTDISCCITSGGGTHQTMNQAYIYVLIESDESTELHETGLD